MLAKMMCVCLCDCSAGNVVKPAFDSAGARRPVPTDRSPNTSCNITPPKSTTDSLLYQSPTFSLDEVDDDFEPMPYCMFLSRF